MKRKILLLSLGLLSLGMFPQKKELKAAEKAIRKGNVSGAKEIIVKLEGSESSIGSKYKAKYLFLKGKVYSKTDILKAADSYNKLFELEKETKKQKYTNEARASLDKLIQEVSAKAIDQYNNKEYKKAKDNFYLTYKISPRDTTFLYNAALSSIQIKDYDSALNYFKELKNNGYTGIITEYYAVNKETGKEENLGTKANRDTFVKLGTYTTPTDKSSPSKRKTIIQNIVRIYNQQGKEEMALATLKEERKENPKDIDFLLDEARIQIRKGNKEDFKNLMKEATTLDPTNATLFYNIGIINAEQKNTKEAIDYLNKAIEIDPNYFDAYMNLAQIIMADEETIINQLNKNLNNEKKYNQLEKKRKNLYNKALPYYLNAFKIKKDNEDLVRTLMGIYDILENTTEADKYRSIYKKISK